MNDEPARYEIELVSPETGQQTVLVLPVPPGDAYRTLTLDARRRLQKSLLTGLDHKRITAGPAQGQRER